MTLTRRVDRLEQAKGSNGDRCPHCPMMELISDSAPDPVCKKCGRVMANVIRVVELIVPSRERQ